MKFTQLILLPAQNSRKSFPPSGDFLTVNTFRVNSLMWFSRNFINIYIYDIKFTVNPKFHS